MDRYPITGRSLEWFFDIDGDLFERQYKCHLSGYRQWKDTAEGVHAEQWRVFPQNIGPHLSIDETSLSRGELYTIVTNKEAHGREDSIVAIVLGTDADTVIHALRQIKSELRNTVKEITLDLSDSMHRICRMAFPRASRVIDRFHVQRLALDAVQEIRIQHRWDAINAETDAREAATFYEHSDEILNFYDNRSTNASAESINSKIKAFRAKLHGVNDTKFFIFRLCNIYA